MTTFHWIAESEADTVHLGRSLAQALPVGMTVWLEGTLGAGKTRLVQAVAEALGVAPGTAVSPTFTLCNEYHGLRKIDHIDLYRVADDDEFQELGLEELFESDSLTFVEWADRFPHLLPRDHLRIQIDVQGESRREFKFSGNGSACESCLKALGAKR